jgi:ATP-dependent RNA helicase DDX3X
MVVMQISDEAKKFAYQTGIRVVVAYGGAPVHNQVRSGCLSTGGWLMIYCSGCCLKLEYNAGLSVVFAERCMMQC